MPDDKKDKILSYRRAVWLSPDENRTLEKYLHNANTKLPTLKDRWIALGEQIVRVAQTQKHKGGLLFHLTTETEGEAASVVPKASPSSTGFDLKTQPPPANAEWLDGDAFLFVRGDHVCLCTTAVNDSAVMAFLLEYFKKAQLPPGSDKFDLQKVADISKIQLLRTQGVKQVELRGALYKASASYVRRKAHGIAALGAAAKHIKAVLTKPNDISPDALHVEIVLKTDERAKGLVVGEKEIENFAAEIVRHAEADDDYVIVTKTGQRITPKEMFVKTTVRIERDGKTVKRDRAWEELCTFFEALKGLGVLEQ